MRSSDADCRTWWRPTVAAFGLAAALVIGSACSSDDPQSGDGATGVAEGPNTTTAVTTSAGPTAPTTSTASPTTSPASSTIAAVPTTAVPTSTPYMVPLADAARAGWGGTHSGYPATDIFVACGAEIVSPVNGVAIDVRTVDSWVPAIDNPATRGGRSVAVLGDDGVRYYVAHLDEVDPTLVVADRVAIGQRLGTVGRTGRSSACHIHFGVSPPCPGNEWSVRRGVVGPARYLDAWRAGEQLSPADEVAEWIVDNPNACADAMIDPNAADA